MVFFIIRIERNEGPDGTNYAYPAGYDPETFVVLHYESIYDIDSVHGRGNADEDILGYSSDKDADTYRGIKQATEISKADALARYEAWVPEQPRISDRQKLLDSVLSIVSVAKDQQSDAAALKVHVDEKIAESDLAKNEVLPGLEVTRFVPEVLK